MVDKESMLSDLGEIEYQSLLIKEEIEEWDNYNQKDKEIGINIINDSIEKISESFKKFKKEFKQLENEIK